MLTSALQYPKKKNYNIERNLIYHNYKKQHNLRVSGGKATLVARVLRYVRDAQQILEPEDNDATSDSELQSSDSEDPGDSRRCTITLQKWATLLNTVTSYSLS